MNDVGNDEMVKVLNDIIKGEKSNYQYLAKFKLASIYSEDKVEEARVIYAELANDEKLIPELREFARYLEIITLLKIDDAGLLKDRIQKLLSQKSNVYKSSDKEIVAISMIKGNDVEKAVGVIKEIIGASDSDAMVYKNAIDLLQIYDN
ncbi:putative integral membrane protein [Ehrlichia ruminantium]|uniref:Putative integral membrane protein n=3 Tax=Ehrlichia ruminantium TaxID=779 RepID=A0A170U1K2_EHRRU|nr:putative integral membrane protein [Ehrlichia ruminantium]GAT79279.1 putative integral membrane protein [Ehrlichia ruminantium]